MFKALASRLAVAGLLLAAVPAAAVAEDRQAAEIAAQLLRLLKKADTADARVVARKTGTVVFHVTLFHISTDIPASAVPTCTGGISHFNDNPDFYLYSAAKTVDATLTATGASCTISVPYEWLKAETANALDLSVDILVPGTAVTRPLLVGSQTLRSVAFPANDGTVHVNATFRY